jgi:hypothetical protein
MAALRAAAKREEEAFDAGLPLPAFTAPARRSTAAPRTGRTVTELRRELAKLIPRPRQEPSGDLRAAAADLGRRCFHEAGHAVTAIVGGIRLNRATTEEVYTIPARDPVGAVSGYVAARLAGYDDFPSASDDAAFAAAGGTKANRLPHEARARQILMGHWPAVAAIATALAARGTLSGRACRAIGARALHRASVPQVAPTGYLPARAQPFVAA